MNLPQSLTLMAGLLAWPPLAMSGEVIYKVADGAYCRNAAGKVEQPKTSVPPGTKVEAAPAEMVVAWLPDGDKCYLFRVEVSLKPPGQADNSVRPYAAVGQSESMMIIGTRGLPDSAHPK